MLVESTLVVVVVERERLAVVLGVAGSSTIPLVVDVVLVTNNLTALHTTLDAAAVASGLGFQLHIVCASCCGGGSGRGCVSGRVGDTLASRAHTRNLVLAILPRAGLLDALGNVALLVAASCEPVLAEVV
jgi:hypothetical protein